MSARWLVPAVVVTVLTAPAGGASLGAPTDPVPDVPGPGGSGLAASLARTPLAGADPVEALDRLRCDPVGARLSSPCRTGDPAAPGGIGRPAVELTPWGATQTPAGPAAVVPLDGGGHVRVHQRGEVASMAEDGTLRWRRPGMQLQHDWPIGHHAMPVVPFGADPAEPIPTVTDDAVAVGDLTGDGVPDVAVAHLVPGDGPELPASVVTVLDGTDGRTRWVDVTDPALVRLQVDDGRLAVADRTPDGNRSRLRSLLLRGDGAELTAETRWTTQGPSQDGRWLDLAPAGTGRLAATWTTDEGDGVTGQVGAFDLETGETVWSLGTDRPPRRVRHDPASDRLVVDLPDVDGTGYRLQVLDAGRGDPVAAWQRDDAVLFDLRPAGGDWLVADATLTDDPRPDRPGTTIDDGRVTAWTPGDGPAWTHREDGRTFLPYRLTVADRHVLAAAYDGPDARTASSLRALERPTGDVGWTRQDDPMHPLWLARSRLEGLDVVVGAGFDMAGRAVAVEDGTTILDAPVPYDIRASAVHDVDRDGIGDLLVGGGSQAVFAIDAESLDPTPTIHWSRRVDGAVHELILDDLAPAPGPELLVVASGGLHVLDPDDGRPLHTVEADAYSWTATVGEVDGDPGREIVHPTRNLSVYDAEDGSLRWRVTPPVETRFSTAAIAPDGTVGVQAIVDPPGAGGPIPVKKPSNWGQKALAFDGATGELAWAQPVPDPSMPRLWRSVIHHPGIDGTDGHALAFVHAERAIDAADPDRDRGRGISMPRTRIDVYDAGDGARRWHAEAPWYFGHQGIAYLDGLVEHNLLGTLRPRPDGSATQTNYLAEHDADRTRGVQVTDLAKLRTGDGPVVALASGGIFVYPDGTTHRDHAPPTTRLDAWGGAFNWGAMTVADLDGDGRDEIVVHPRDAPAYRTVIGWRGVQTLRFGSSPHGLAVLGFGDPPAPDDGVGATRSVPGPELAVVAMVGVAGAILRRRAS